MHSYAVVVLFAASVLWGLSWLPLKYLNQQGFDGLSLTLYLYLIMFSLMLPWVWSKRHELKPHWKVLLSVALLGGGAQLAFNTALIYGDVIRVMVLFYLVPIWGVLGGRLFLGEVIDKGRWLGVGLAISGAFLIVGGMSAFITPPSWVDGLALLSGFLLAMNNIVFRVSQGGSVRLKIAFMFFGSVVLSATILLFQPEPPVFDIDGSAWLVLFLYGAIWMMFANFGTQWAVTHLEVGRSSIILIMELVTAIVSASLILGETMLPIEMLGGGLILIAAFIEARRST